MITNASVSIHDDFRRLVDLIPLSLDPNPDIGLRVVVNGKEYASVNFQNGSLKKVFPIHLGKRMIGTIEIFDRRPQKGAGKTLSFQEALRIQAIADHMGWFLAQRSHEKQILEYLFIEQNRIGQYLHDNLCQHLTGIAFMIQVLEQDLLDQSVKEAQDVANIIDLVGLAITQTRGLAGMVGPGPLGGNRIIPAIEEMAASFEKLFKISCRFKSDPTIYIQRNEMARQLYFVAQEAINFAIRYHGAKLIEIGLSKCQQKITLAINYATTVKPHDRGRDEKLNLSVLNRLADHMGAVFKIRCHQGDCHMTCVLQTARMDLEVGSEKGYVQKK